MVARNRKITQNLVTEDDLNSTVSKIPALADTLPGTAEKQLWPVDLMVTSVTSVTASDDTACSGNQQDEAMVTPVTATNKVSLPAITISVENLINEAIDPNEEPPIKINALKINRPCYAVYDEWMSFSEQGGDQKKPGVYYHGRKNSKDDDEIVFDDYICDPLHIDAGSCDSSEQNFGLMLRFKNQRHRWRKWLMPLEAVWKFILSPIRYQF